MDPNEVNEDGSGLDRRSVLKRGAVLGGAMVWTVPAVQTIAGPAFATGSPRCDARLIGISQGQCRDIVYKDTEACCDCINQFPTELLPLAIAFCAVTGKCEQQSNNPCTA